jgi:hypothetical protein
MRSLLVALLAALASMPARAAGPASVLAPFAAAGSAPEAPWKLTGLPGQTKPFTRFSVVDVDGQRALRVEADASYGNLLHPLRRDAPHAQLSWRWRVDELDTAADLRARQGDDTALKVCTLWDLPLERLAFVERQLLRVARSRTTDPVPAATVCYVWDAHLPVGTAIDNAFTRRLRYLVLRSGEGHVHEWSSERRDIEADFRQLFGDEAAELPPLVGVAVGADADNTKGHSVGLVSDLVLEP